MKITKCFLLILTLAFSFALIQPAKTEDSTVDSTKGKLIWQDQFSGTGWGLDRANAIAAEGSRVFVAGEVKNEDTDYDFTVRAYNAKTGKLLWQDQYDGTGSDWPLESDFAYAIAVKESLVFVAGVVDNIDTGGDFTVRAYNTWNGELRWHDQFDGMEHVWGDYANAIAVKGGRVFVAGAVSGDFTVRTYHTKTGKLLWQDQDSGGEANAIAVKEGRVFVAGWVWNVDTGWPDFTVRAFNSKTGKLLWQDQFDGTANVWDEANAIAVEGSRVLVAGEVWNEGTDKDFTVRAYQANTGKLLWQDQFDGTGHGDDYANAIAVKGSRAFVAGRVYNVDTLHDFTVRSYNAKTGKLLWQDQLDGTQYQQIPIDSANAIAVKGGLVFVAGSVDNVDTNDDFTVRAYNTWNGELRWQDQFDGTDSWGDEAYAIAVDRSRVFVAGMVTDIDTDFDFTVRAYKRCSFLLPDLNNFVTFELDPSTYTFTIDTTDCQAGAVGKFTFDATLTNISEKELSDLNVEVDELTNNNLLLTTKGLIGEGERFEVPKIDDYADGLLSPDEYVDVPFIVCLKNTKPFGFFVNVIGDAGD